MYGWPSLCSPVPGGAGPAPPGAPRGVVFVQLQAGLEGLLPRFAAGGAGACAFVDVCVEKLGWVCWGAGGRAHVLRVLVHACISPSRLPFCSWLAPLAKAPWHVAPRHVSPFSLAGCVRVFVGRPAERTGSGGGSPFAARPRGPRCRVQEQAVLFLVRGPPAKVSADAVEVHL
jgi:hypothetical protein